VWYATLPHRQVFGGEYVGKTFATRAAFDREVSLRLGTNHAIRRAAFRDQVTLFDLELDLADRTDIFYDMFHLNAVGGEAVARSLIACGFAAGLQTAIEAVEAHGKAK
jgi:hypothetical protein